MSEKFEAIGLMFSVPIFDICEELFENPTYTPEPLWDYSWFHQLLKILLHN
jgi:hypothetical protein